MDDDCNISGSDVRDLGCDGLKKYLVELKIMSDSDAEELRSKRVFYTVSFLYVQILYCTFLHLQKEE